MDISPKFVRLKPSEWDFIADRLEGAPDAIADALGIDISVVEAITVHDKTCHHVILRVPAGSEEALADAIEGSTVLDRAREAYRDGEISSAQWHRKKATANKAWEALYNAGIRCESIPRKIRAAGE